MVQRNIKLIDTSIIVTGGGTGGHLRIAKSLIDELYCHNIKIIYIGSLNGYDRKWFENDDNIYKTIFYNTKGVVNKNIFGKIASLFKIFKSTVDVAVVIKQYNVKGVISVGGYSAAPASFGAIMSKTSLFVHEQNAYTGELNKLLRKYAKRFYSSYDMNSPIKDYPTDKKFFIKSRIRDEVKTIIFLGGSQGATFINDYAMKIATYLNKNNIKIIHQTGEKDFQRVNKFYQSHNIDVDIFDFSNNIEDKFHQADIAVSRSGASTMWELVANNLPTIFIPYPYASNNHQYQNAKFLEDKSLCFLFTQDQFKTDNDYIAVVEEFILKDLKKISQGLKDEIKQDGIKKIVNDILSSI